MNLHVDFIICTYNGSIYLKRVLDSILGQCCLNVDYNIILVDNNSSTIEVKRYKSILSTFNNRKIKLIHEPKAGLNHARKTGVENSFADIIIFVDDDNILDKSFLSETLDVFINHPEVGACCGKNIPFLEAFGMNSFPVWFEAEKRKYACGSMSLTDGLITWSIGECWGAGMSIRARIARQIFKLDNTFLTFDRKGNELSSGGDTELSYWVVLLGFDLYFSNSVVLHHLINENRLTESYLRELSSSMIKSGSILSVYKRHLSTERRLRQKQNDLVPLLKSAFKLILQINKEWLFLYSFDSEFLCRFFMSEEDYRIWFNRKQLRNVV